MTATNASTGSNVHEIADGIYRINTPVALPDGVGFSFNQYLHRRHAEQRETTSGSRG